ALPLVRVGERAGAGERAVVGGQRLAVDGRAGDARRGRAHRRRGGHGGARGGARGVVARDVRAGDDDAYGAADVAGAERVGAGRGSGDVGAVRAVGVAALPLVRVGDRVGAREAAGVGAQRAAVLRAAGDGRRGDG